MKKPNTATLAFIALGLIWGCVFIFTKWASRTITPLQITLLRVLFGFVPVLIYALLCGYLKREHVRYLHHFFVMSVLATSAYYFAYASGTVLLPSGVAGALSGSIPLFSFVSAAIFLRSERITLLRFLGILIGCSGVLLIARPWDTNSAVNMTGVMYMLVGSASVGLSFVYTKKFLAGLDIAPAALTTYQMGLGLLTLALVTDRQGITAIMGDPKALIGLVLGLGLFGTGIAYILYYFIVEQLGAIAASSVTYLLLVVSVAIGWLLVKEPISVMDGAGIFLILAGMIAVQFRGQAGRKRTSKVSIT